MKTDANFSSAQPSQPVAQVFRTDGDELLVKVPAQGVDPSWLARPLAELGFPAHPGAGALHVEAAQDWQWGSVDAAFLARVLEALRTGSHLPALIAVPPDLAKLLMLACGAGPAAADAGATAPPGFIARVGLRFQDAARELGALVTLLGEVSLRLPRLALRRAKVRRADVVETLAESSSRALAIVAVVNLLMGAILAFVGAVELKRFGAGIYVADLVGVASVRELTPILTGIVLAGRTGASFAARIATMQGNEEIDALTTLGISPVEFLVLPRAVALTLLMPLLYVYGCTFAILGGLSVSAPMLDLSSAAYWAETRNSIGAANFAIGGLKSAVFGALVALLGCHYGLQAERSAAGVGTATTGAVVASIVGIIVIDAVFAVCANALDV